MNIMSPGKGQTFFLKKKGFLSCKKKRKKLHTSGVCGRRSKKMPKKGGREMPSLDLIRS